MGGGFNRQNISQLGHISIFGSQCVAINLARLNCFLSFFFPSFFPLCSCFALCYLRLVSTLLSSYLLLLQKDLYTPLLIYND